MSKPKYAGNHIPACCANLPLIPDRWVLCPVCNNNIQLKIISGGYGKPEKFEIKIRGDVKDMSLPLVRGSAKSKRSAAEIGKEIEKLCKEAHDTIDPWIYFGEIEQLALELQGKGGK